MRGLAERKGTRRMEGHTCRQQAGCPPPFTLRSPRTGFLLSPALDLGCGAISQFRCPVETVGSQFRVPGEGIRWAWAGVHGGAESGAGLESLLWLEQPRVRGGEPRLWERPTRVPQTWAGM